MVNSTSTLVWMGHESEYKQACTVSVATGWGEVKGMGTLSGVVGWVAQVGIKQQHSPYHKGINTVQSEYTPVSITCMQIRP